ncbi:putative polysaccharide deacetylase [Selenomonas ruminantium subsp. lactilytica TAM6421]|uniref:Putative polysaccharide deacetylase n=1 Tax=Selenomonas ruminantium subsp. lactilytica (strain NBRC 103574 / TAM6421) TaxID=927704 RepID=I0GS41_SELRL|nr:polysaccharide deacetylase family protein [Selenomonas ruminantium]BAL83578.1 putative polysaccharide deacetylase [Selenomonas ruminantium subsp. lactilytica TAM6421]
MTIWIKRLLLLLAAVVLTVLAVCFYLIHSADQSVPVLNYHQINDRDENALTVHTDQFEAQMRYLAEEGYHVITPEEMINAWENGEKLPEKPVIITFDDGYADNYRNAFPILQKYNLKATIFLISDYVSTYPNYLTWTQVSEMQDSGLIDFESHTLSHEQLDSTSPEETWNQLDGSKKALEWHLQKEINFLAYPCGSYDEELQQLVKKAGYKGAFTVNYGLADKSENHYILDRVPIFGCTNHTLMRFKLRLQYTPIFAPLAKLNRELLAGGHNFLARFVPTP